MTKVKDDNFYVITNDRSEKNERKTVRKIHQKRNAITFQIIGNTY